MARFLGIWVWGLAIVLFVVGRALAGEPSPEQKERLETLEKTAKEHEQAGRVKEASAAGEELLALERSVYGNDSDPTWSAAARRSPPFKWNQDVDRQENGDRSTDFRSNDFWTL